MLHKIRILYENNKIWIYLSKHLIFSVLLAFLILSIDTGLLPIHSYLPDFLLTGVDLAKTILGTLSGSLLTITTFTFSTIMVVMTTYSSNYSPRVVDNFLTDKISMKVLGFFTGGFLYCLLTLLFMRSTPENYKVLSATVAVLYSVVCIIYFIRFVFSVSSSMQASKLIYRLFQQSMELIEETMTFREHHETLNDFDTKVYPHNYTVQSAKFGYLELVNWTSLMDLLQGLDCAVHIHGSIGTFFSKNTDLFTLYYMDPDSFPEKMDQKIEQCFTFTQEKMTISDYKFTIQKIMEIALRAISPGVNDPYTAIHCIRFLGVLLSRIGEASNPFSVLRKENGLGRILYEDFHFSQILSDTCSQIIHYGKEDLYVMDAVFESLKNILRCCDVENIPEVKNFARYVYDEVIPYHTHERDRLRLDRHLQQIQNLAKKSILEKRGTA